MIELHVFDLFMIASAFTVIGYGYASKQVDKVKGLIGIGLIMLILVVIINLL